MNREELMAQFPAHRSRLVSALTRLVGPDAEDIANETLLRALDAIDGFQEQAALGTWLHRIATNLAYDHLRRLGRQPVEFMGHDALPDLAEEGPDHHEQRQMSACVQQVLETLPDAQRQLLLQADVLELTAAEIAEESDISVGNAKIRLHRARRALEAELSSRCDFHRRDEGVLCCTPKPAR